MLINKINNNKNKIKKLSDLKERNLNKLSDTKSYIKTILENYKSQNDEINNINDKINTLKNDLNKFNDLKEVNLVLKNEIKI